MEIYKDDYCISDQHDRLDYNVIHNFLTRAYWCEGRTFEEVRESCKNSICFGLYKGNDQIGFARIVSDRLFIAYLMDVFILPEFRGRGLSMWLMDVILNHSDLKKVETWMLATRDAHTLYGKFGFEALDDPSKYMKFKRK